MTILDTLAAEAHLRVEADLGHTSLSEMKARALDTYVLPGFPLEGALAAPRLSFICEVKKASPSKGPISPDFPYLQIAREYEEGGADAISVLTEPKHFLGSDRYLSEIAAEVSIPVLRKDFTVDAYQIYQARALGASAVLLICSILTDAQLSEFLGLADSLGLSCLTEAHDAEEVERAVRVGARIIGVNNRNLHDFSVDSSNSATLRELVPRDRLFVSESGVTSREDAAQIQDMGADGVLIGEALMRASDRRSYLRELVDWADTAMGSHCYGFGPLNSGPPTFYSPDIKICGISRDEDIPVLNETLPEYVGFVFHPASSRYVDLETALCLRGLLDERIETVGVFVDESPERIAEVVESGAISIVQLHGHEDADYLEDFYQSVPSAEVIWAIGVRDVRSIVEVERLDIFKLLLDNERGGSGEPFDWAILGEARRIAHAHRVHLPSIWLGGGLTPDNVAAAARLRVDVVDVSSGVETNGHKDPALIRAFIAAARSVTDAQVCTETEPVSVQPELLDSPGGE
ncbi:MAG: indole-3-glycerol phosphate synthase TrpC [Propionibacteriaceae bacterium]|jgi:indole-3-glycerol phosphate synthase/phosphoribosylanthranilate isomerase|nr:indole-3-glycerol phosphate synthase TrpC [Propionibacteriaceae bacterium]